MANQWSQSPTRASLSVRGAAYDVEVRADEDQLQLVLEDASNGQAWSGSFAGNCTCLPYYARSLSQGLSVHKESSLTLPSTLLTCLLQLSSCVQMWRRSRERRVTTSHLESS